MKTTEYLDRLLAKYAGTFDIYQPYVIHGKEYPAYGYFFSHVEKYVLVREANMWSSDSYEHILFVETEEVSERLIKEAYLIVKDYMEPHLVRKGEELPGKNHMYSYLSIAILADKPLSTEMKRAVKKFKYEKTYQMNMRGFSQAHILCATMEDEKVYTNFVAKQSAKTYRETFGEVREGRPGYSELI